MHFRFDVDVFFLRQKLIIFRRNFLTHILRDESLKKFTKLKYCVREKISAFKPKRKNHEKYFPFHLIFHSLNTEILKWKNLLNETKRDRENFLCQKGEESSFTSNQHLNFDHVTYISEKEFSESWVLRETVDFCACYFIGNFLSRSNWVSGGEVWRGRKLLWKVWVLWQRKRFSLFVDIKLYCHLNSSLVGKRFFTSQTLQTSNIIISWTVKSLGFMQFVWCWKQSI